MAAKETVIGKFVNQILFKVDKSSVDDAKSAISEVKGFAAKALGAIGIGFSFTKLASLAEEFGSINDTIRGATREMGDQADIQQKILQGAQDCREEYGVMAGDVTKLVQLNSKLFPVDDAVKFVSLVEKLEKGSGREANLDNTMSVLQKAIRLLSIPAAARRMKSLKRPKLSSEQRRWFIVNAEMFRRQSSFRFRHRFLIWSCLFWERMTLLYVLRA